MPDPRNYRVEETLKDSTTLIVRAVRPDDGDRIRAAFRQLDRSTVYTRFFGFKNDVTDEELRRITGVDFDRDVALLATIGSGEQETVIGGASYFGLNAGSPCGSAEVAFTVEEDYQGLGVASALLRHLVGIARQKDLGRLVADVLASNPAMLAVFRRSGLPMSLRREGDVVHISLALRSTAG
jgi:RimJ/RimL family protein N-acetyltransferase